MTSPSLKSRRGESGVVVMAAYAGLRNGDVRIDGREVLDAAERLLAVETLARVLGNEREPFLLREKLAFFFRDATRAALAQCEQPANKHQCGAKLITPERR